MTEALEKYEKQIDDEAVFVKALDKILSPMLNILARGKLWKEYGIKRSDVIENKDKKTKNSPEVHQLWQVLRREILAHDEWFNPTDERTASEDTQDRISPE